MVPDPQYQVWWESTWRERESLLKGAFGETSPPATVVGFEWDDFELTIPGACALVFPPHAPQRPQWLTISHGLSQPLEPRSTSACDAPSGYGFEFGFLTETRAEWCIGAIGQLMTYLRQSGSIIGRGHRVPMWFSMADDRAIIATLGRTPETANARPLGDMRALLFWPYMARPAGFSTSTGYFNLLVGTTISEAEWKLVQATSPSHLLLLLFEAGIGQISDLRRETITRESKWNSVWDRIMRLSEKEADESLLQISSCG